MAATFPKQGRKSAGVARQYCGRLGKVANCQGGMFLAYVSPLGRALVDKRLYLPKSWTSDQVPVCCGGCAGGRRNYRSKAELALEMLERVHGVGLPQGRVGCRRRRLRDVADLPGGTGGPGDALRAADVPGGTTVWPLDPAWTSPEYPGFPKAALRKPKLRPGQRRTRSSAVMANCRMRLGREITVAPGSQGPRTYRFSAQRVRATRRRKPGEELWAVWRRNLDGSEPRYYLPTLPRANLGDSGLRGWADVGH